jgi:hypothetical protein
MHTVANMLTPTGCRSHAKHNVPTKARINPITARQTHNKWHLRRRRIGRVAKFGMLGSELSPGDRMGCFPCDIVEPAGRAVKVRGSKLVAVSVNRSSPDTLSAGAASSSSNFSSCLVSFTLYVVRRDDAKKEVIAFWNSVNKRYYIFFGQTCENVHDQRAYQGSIRELR